MNVPSRQVAIVLLGALLSGPAVGQEIYDVRAQTDRALAQRTAGDYDAAIATLQRAVSADPTAVSTRLLLAETLAWAKRFSDAEREYRTVLRGDPASHDATIGLARVLLWQGRYADARRLFVRLHGNDPGDLDAADGAATAAYWSGDYRTAEREFAMILQRDPKRATAGKSLAEIESAAAPIDRVAVDAVDDDQPYRTLRASTSTSRFSDPLTRWDAAAGSWWMHASRSGIGANAPFVRIGNETTFPAWRLAAAASIGAMRYPDGSTHPIGSASLSWRVTPSSSVSAAIEQYEMLATATAIDRHISGRATSLQWKKDAPHGWTGALDARRIEFSDSNRGWSAAGYALHPMLTRPPFALSAGASFALRDTSESRFYIESLTSRQSGSAFLYSYRGAYTPYWTPRGFRELRGILAAEAAIRRSHVRLQIDGGATRDRGTNFGPDSGTTPFPTDIFPFEFRRTYHPIHLQLSFTTPIASGISLETAVERSTTVFYRANGIRASLVRRR